MPLIPALGRQTKAVFCEFEASLVYRTSSRTVRAIQRNLVLREKKETKKIEKERIWIFFSEYVGRIQKESGKRSMIII